MSRPQQSLLRQRLRALQQRDNHSQTTPPTMRADSTSTPTSPRQSSVSASSESLTSWEEDLTHRLGSSRLIGEINLSREELEHLGASIEIFVRRQRADADHALVDTFPVATIVFLVFSGIYAY